MTPYQEALQFTLGNEGGYYDGSEALDPNPTNYGVTQRTYDAYRQQQGLPEQPVRSIAKGEVEDIYHGYWHYAYCDLLPRLAAITLFDHSINAGPTAAAKILQKALGVTPDGIIGPVTRKAVEPYLTQPDGGAELADRICWERIRFYVDLAKSERLRPNLLSWTHRVVRFREAYLK